MPLKICAYRKRGMVVLSRGIEPCSVRPWRVELLVEQELI